MKKIFIDAGAFDGDTIQWFREREGSLIDWEIHAFEPNPRLADVIETGFPDVNVHREAVWIHDGETEFFLGNDPTGSTLMKNKESGAVDYGEPITVQAVDFAEWIKTHCSYDDTVVIKMDIEGAEFEVLPRMIDSGAMLFVTELLVELHPNKCRDYTTDDAEELKKRIKALPVKFTEWH